MHLFFKRLAMCASLGGFLMGLAGCGGPAAPKRIPAPVKGTVSFRGSPVKKGQITFQPASGAAVGAEIKEGAYSMEAIVGPNTVMVVNREPEPGPAGADPEKRKNPPPPQDPKTIVPPEYGTPNSPLKFEVKTGDNKADFDIK